SGFRFLHVDWLRVNAEATVRGLPNISHAEFAGNSLLRIPLAVINSVDNGWASELLSILCHMLSDIDETLSGLPDNQSHDNPLKHGRQKMSCHTRSISLPSRSHPLTATLEDHLCRLRVSKASSSSSICCRLNDLKDLYGHIEDLLQLPQTQQSLSQKRNEKWVEEVIDGSLRMLDICSTTREIFSQMKESIQELKSSLRRKRRGESSLVNEID
ncbi:Protein BPS1, chloroplastic, partial [Dillenia turbinata]